MVSVTCRTEYLTGRHHVSAQVAWVAMVAALIALVALNIAGVSGVIVAAVVAGLIVVSLGAAAFGRTGERGAVLLAVDDDVVLLGAEERDLVSYPLASLTSSTLSGPADATTAGSTQGHDLLVRGARYLTLTFDASIDGSDSPAGSSTTGADAEVTWQVAVIDSDPAAAEVISRLRRQAPERTQQQTPQKEKQSAAAPPVFAAAGPPASTGPRVADAGTDEAAQRLWEEATERHDKILSDYATYELDPATMLRYPAMTDVTVEATQTFHLALDGATALRTDAYPGDRSRADGYQQAVASLRRAWIACETYGKKVGLSYLEPADQEELDTALKLYRHAASSTTAAEQATYYGRVHDIVTTMTDRGGLHPPEAVVAELKAVTRRAIEARES